MSSDRPDPVIRIRKMTAEDLASVIEIDQLSFSQPWPANSFHFELYNNPAARLWVAEYVAPGEPKRIAGMTVIWLVIDEAHIGTIAVHPDYRRRGIAARMLAHSLTRVREEGANIVFLEVRRSNLSAQALYRQFGFYLFDERKGYYPDNGEDALIFVLDHLQTRDFSRTDGR